MFPLILWREVTTPFIPSNYPETKKWIGNHFGIQFLLLVLLKVTRYWFFLTMISRNDYDGNSSENIMKNGILRAANFQRLTWNVLLFLTPGYHVTPINYTIFGWWRCRRLVVWNEKAISINHRHDEHVISLLCHL